MGLIADRTDHAAGFGLTNLHHPLPVDPDNLFRVRSTTKTVTGTTVMCPVEQRPT
jgi:CubicO group peptidase (beta-lactamase class C family)